MITKRGFILRGSCFCEKYSESVRESEKMCWVILMSQKRKITERKEEIKEERGRDRERDDNGLRKRNRVQRLRLYEEVRYKQ